MEGRPTPAHVYHSTGCYHDHHGHCRNDRALSGAPKEPHTCKFCSATCLCPCHQGVDISDISPQRLRVLTLTAMIKTYVGSYDDVDFGAVKNIMATLAEILGGAGNPWRDEPPPADIDDALQHGIDVVRQLRDLQ